jgi:hypothetical protein
LSVPVTVILDADEGTAFEPFVASVRSLVVQEYVAVEINAGLKPVTVALPSDKATLPVTT